MATAKRVKTESDPPKLRIEYWKIERLKSYEKNPRKNDAVIDKIVESIQAFGFSIPILARSSDGLICDGHLRAKGAAKLGMKEVPVIPCDNWSEDQIRSFRILANRSASWATFDDSLLQKELADLVKSGFDLKLTGFDTKETEGLLAGLGMGGKKQKPATEKDSKTIQVNQPVISYLIVFNSEDEQRHWLDFLKKLRTVQPEMATVGERVAWYVENNPPKA